jgi:hypothetical protein
VRETLPSLLNQSLVHQPSFSSLTHIFHLWKLFDPFGTYNFPSFLFKLLSTIIIFLLFQVAMTTPPFNLQDLISGTEALNCDDPSTLETLPLATPLLALHRLIGKLLSSKPPSAYWLRETLVNSWKFAHPFEITDLLENKYHIIVSHQAHVDKIMELGPWNIKGSLLVLTPWTPDLTFEEVELFTCAFWVQIHGLPLQNMTARMLQV